MLSKSLSILASMLIALLLFFPMGINAEVPELIELNPPDLDRGHSVMKAFSLRASNKSFNPKPLEIQDLSDVIWAANGINRPEKSLRTAPTAMNAQDIDIYVFMEQGVYFHNAGDHVLELLVKGDHRDIVAGRQPTHGEAPVMLLMVSDISRFRGGDEATKLKYAAMDSAIVSQNINLFCAGTGLYTVTRAIMEHDKIRELLELSETQYPMLNNPVSYSIE